MSRKAELGKCSSKYDPEDQVPEEALLTQHGSELGTMCGELYLQPEDRRLYRGDRLPATAGHQPHMVITWLLLATNWLGLQL